MKLMFETGQISFTRSRAVPTAELVLEGSFLLLDCMCGSKVDVNQKLSHV